MAFQSANPLVYAVRGGVIAKYLGQLCGVLACLNLLPLVVALGYGEESAALRYLVVAAVLILPALFTKRLRRPVDLQINEALAITVLAFIVGSLAMMYPFMGAGLSWLDALFESVSGITTTGLSTLADVEDKPQSFLFARAWLQWYGGLGIVVFSLALLLGPGVVARRLAGAGADISDIAGTSRIYTRRVMSVYLLLTLTGIVIAITLGQDPFSAVVHILAAVSTGGFSSFNTSLSSVENWGVQMTVLAACLSGGIPLALYYQTWRRGWNNLVSDREVQALFVFILLLTFALWLLQPQTKGLEALGHAAAMAVSTQTTSGFSTVNVAELDAGAKGALILSMFLGGGMSSTAGGIKIVRFLILLRLLQILILRTALPPHAVVEPHLNGTRLQVDEIQRALLIILLYALTISLSWLPFLAYGHDPLNALFDVVSATATVGLSAGVVHPELEPVLKGVLCLDMLLGRLEILALVALCYPATWFTKRKNTG